LKTAEQDFIDSLRGSLDDAEKLLREAAEASGDKAAELREKAVNSLNSTREGLSEAQDVMLERGRRAACGATNYVHEQPWHAIGAASLAGLVIGMLISRR